MPEVKYLLLGSSHAALEALRAIRQVDAKGSMAMVTRDGHRPYSPTILPYVVSGRTPAERTILRDQAFFAAHDCAFVGNAEAVGLDTKTRRVTLADGSHWQYEKLLIGTGAVPAVPPVPGLDGVAFHVLRSLDDAANLRQAMRQAKRAVVLGGGLVGLHAAENLAEAGLAVSVVEMRPQVLPGYFAASASARIEAAFTAHGVALHLGRRATGVAPAGSAGGFTLTLDDGQQLPGDLLLVAAGVKPTVGWLAGSGVAIGQGILVDDLMQTSVPDVWAAGDVVEAKDFASGAPALIGIIPTAVEQGRIAGMAMAGDPYVKPYAGGLPVNTYRFFGRVALSIGQATATDGVEAIEQDTGALGQGTYRRMVMAGDRLVGYATVDEPFDVGVMGELIRRRADLSGCRQDFLARPVETARRLMSQGWR